MRSDALAGEIHRRIEFGGAAIRAVEKLIDGVFGALDAHGDDRLRGDLQPVGHIHGAHLHAYDGGRKRLLIRPPVHEVKRERACQGQNFIPEIMPDQSLGSPRNRLRRPDTRFPIPNSPRARRRPE